MLIAGTDSQLQAFDPINGNIIKSYKACEPHDFATSPYGILAVQINKPLIFQFGKKETNLKKIVLPEKVACIKVSPCSKYLICGACSGRILLWSLQSGQLLAAQDAHFQQVSCISWSDDSALVITGGADARVLVWKLYDLVAQDVAEPKSLSAALAITDVQCGKGDWNEARIFVSAKDGTVCVYDAANLERLTTFAVPETVLRICVDPIERAIYAATPKGVHILLLYTVKNGRLQALGGLGDVVSGDNHQLLEGEPLALVLNEDATLLYVGDSQGVITTWDVGTKQIVRRSKPLRGAVHTLELGNFEPLELPQLQRIVGDSADLVLDQSTQPISLGINEEDVLECWQGVEVQSAAPALQDTSALKEEINELKKKNKQLQELYDNLWKES